MMTDDELILFFMNRKNLTPAELEAETQQLKGQLINEGIREKYSQDQMEAIINNYVSEPDNLNHKQEWEEKEEWRKKVKANVEERINKCSGKPLIQKQDPIILKSVTIEESKPVEKVLKSEYPYVNEKGIDQFDKIKYYAEDKNNNRYAIKRNDGEIANEFIENYPCTHTYEVTDTKVR